MPRSESDEAILAAIDVLTALFDGDGSAPEDELTFYVERARAQDDPETLIGGLGSVCAMLLIKREKEQGVPALKTLQDIALRASG